VDFNGLVSDEAGGGGIEFLLFVRLEDGA